MSDQFSSQSNESKPEQSRKKFQLKPRIQFGLIVGSSILPTLLFLLLRIILNTDISKVYYPLIAYPIYILILNFVFYQKAKIPFEVPTFKIFMQEIGLKVDKNLWKYLLLGIILGILSLTGMLLGSLFSNKYVFNLDQLELEQVLFATVPGIWEEVFYRGLMMLVLLKIFKNTRKTIVIQSIIFGLLHFQGFQLWDLVDVVSVMVIGFAFTYVAHQSNSIIPGMIFHFLHDAFIFLVQVPETTEVSNIDNLLFYLCLWAFQGIICVISYFFNRKILKSPEKFLYDYNHLTSLISTVTHDNLETIKNTLQ